METDQLTAHVEIEPTSSDVSILCFDHDGSHAKFLCILKTPMPQPAAQALPTIVQINHQVPEENSVVPAHNFHVQQADEFSIVFGNALIGLLRSIEPLTDFELCACGKIIQCSLIEGLIKRLLNQTPLDRQITPFPNDRQNR